jgi:2-polyprenyl-6-methoxyphenol hydroxylase-like FAD-dependent oxidoreductase
VVILERDQLPLNATPRPGAPQSKQAHGLLGGAIQALEELFPGFAEDLVHAGAVPVDPGSDVSLEIPGLEPFPKNSLGWKIYSMSRPLIELTIRQRVAQQGNITLRSRCSVLEILGTPDGARVAGVRCRTADEDACAISADLVVDASKHGSLTLSFLESAGQPEPEETTIGVDIRYATAIFALRPGALTKIKALVTFPKPPEDVRAGYLLPMENGYYQLLLVGRGEEGPPADLDGFLAYARKLNTSSISDAMEGATAMTEVARYGFPESKWRHFGRLDRFPRNLLPVGDAICCLNPVYGQGITLAIQEAVVLRRILRAQASMTESVAAPAKDFLTKAEALLADPWSISAIPDLVYPQTRGERPADLEDRLKREGAIARLALRDRAFFALFIEVRHLLKPLSALDEPELARRIEQEVAATEAAHR